MDGHQRVPVGREQGDGNQGLGLGKEVDEHQGLGPGREKWEGHQGLGLRGASGFRTRQGVVASGLRTRHGGRGSGFRV